MIENIRKYNGLIILGLVTVAVALVVGLQSSSVRGMGGGNPYLKIDGRTYTDDEYRQLGIGALDIIGSLARGGDFELYRYLYSVAPQAINPEAGNAAREDYFTNRILLRKAAEEFGIYPGQEEISDRIRSIRTFTNTDGEFDATAYATFLKRGLGPLGMTENDFRVLINDIIATDKVRDIVGAGLTANRDAMARDLILNEQEISAALARLDIAPYKESIQPTDEELKAYWELIQDAFTTEAQRKFSYILITPDMPEEPAAEQEEETPSIVDAAMTDEAKEKAAKEKTEADAKRDAELAEQRRAAQRALDEKVNIFTDKLLDQNGQGFDELVAEEGWELKTTDLVTQSNPPAELALKLRSSTNSGQVITELFKITPTSEPISKISEPIGVGDHQWLVARLEEEVPARPKTFEEAKPDVLEQYIAEKASEELQKAAEKAAQSIQAALAEGKTFQQAADDAGMIGHKNLNEITSSYRPAPLTEPSNLFQSISTIDPGELTDPIIQDGRAFLIHVTTRQIVEDDQREERINNQVDVATNRMQMTAFSDWLSASKRAANVQPLYRQ